LVAYGATYSDGMSGFSGQGYYGGNNHGETDASGTWKDTWVVGPTAPAGAVNVDVAGLRQNTMPGHIAATFDVADKLGNCPGH
jgi:hypothetical protein